MEIIKKDLKFIAVLSLIFLFVSSVDMYTTYRFVNVLGIESEGNTTLVNLYKIAGNYAFLLFPFLASFVFFVLMSGSFLVFSLLANKKIAKINIYVFFVLVFALFCFIIIKNLSAV